HRRAQQPGGSRTPPTPRGCHRPTHVRRERSGHRCAITEDSSRMTTQSQTRSQTTPRLRSPDAAPCPAPQPDRDASTRSEPGCSHSGGGLTDVIVTASLTNGIARVAHGRKESTQLIDFILRTEHIEWETILYVGEVEYHATPHGPFPNHQLRISVSPRAGLAALNYTDNDDEEPMMNSFNPAHPLPDVDLIFSA